MATRTRCSRCRRPCGARSNPNMHGSRALGEALRAWSPSPGSATMRVGTEWASGRGVAPGWVYTAQVELAGLRWRMSSRAPRELDTLIDALQRKTTGRINPTRRNPGMRNYQPIDHGVHYVSDVVAGRLARRVGKALPRPGKELRVELAGGKLAWLTRTPYRAMADAPKRGWVWAVH